jgi:hypothetical protein
VHEACQDNSLQGFLADVHDEAELPTDVSLLRIFAVLVWMEGRAQATKGGSKYSIVEAACWNGPRIQGGTIPNLVSIQEVYDHRLTARQALTWCLLRKK